MKITVAKKVPKCDAVVFLCTKKEDIGNSALEKPLMKGILSAVETEEDTVFKNGIHHFRLYGHPVKFAVTAGTGSNVTVEKIRRISSGIVKCLNDLKVEKASILISDIEKIDKNELLKAVIESAMLTNYRFDKYRSSKPPKRLSEITIIEKKSSKISEQAVSEAVTLAQAVMVARDLVNEPANVIYPETLAKKASELGRKHGFITQIFNEKEIAKLKMDAFLAVSRASVRKPRLIVMRYTGDPSKKNDITALVGKGLTYDSGGLALKQADGMKNMKNDMAGSAAVIGAMCAIASMKLKVNVTGVVAACENAIGGDAYRNGDIIGSMSGKTIEVLNTDAEGRLTLADAVYYAAKKENATRIIDIATLTGAVLVALGMTTAGVISNDDTFYSRLETASHRSGEQIWRLPHFEEYREMIRSDIADIKNTGSGRLAGTITGGLFVGEFTEKLPWIHIDIAGTSWADKTENYITKYGTGYGVRLLYHLLANH